MITLSYTLDMYPRENPVVVHLNQYDDDFQLVFTIMTSYGVLNIQSGTTAMIRGTKKDGHGYSADATIDIQNNTITVAGNKQMTAASGFNVYELVLTKSNKVLSTSNFVLYVERAAMDADTIQSDTVLRELNAIIESSAIATQAAEDASDAADRAEAAAETLEIDDTLTQQGQAADAKATGDAISDLSSAIDEFEPLSDDIKTALLDCFAHVALWTDGDGRQYYDALEEALYGKQYPDLTTGTITNNAYFDASGNIVETDNPAQFIHESYFEIEPDTSYIWIRGFDGFVEMKNGALSGGCQVYRVCYYDENKDFIRRDLAPYATDFGVTEQRYYTLQPPNNAKYFRVSWNFYPIGSFFKSIPADLYAVTLVLAKLDDSQITNNDLLMNRMSVWRNSINVTHDVMYGRDDMDEMSAQEITDYFWLYNVFNINQGGSPEYGNQNIDTRTRIQNRFAFLMRAGDVIKFNNVKAGVRAERISDGYVQHTTAWITDNSDFVVGGE